VASGTFYRLPSQGPAINFGFGGRGQEARADPRRGHFNRKIRAQRSSELGGIKSHYSDSYYPEEEFWQIFDRDAYQALKATFTTRTARRGDPVRQMRACRQLTPAFESLEPVVVHAMELRCSSRRERRSEYAEVRSEPASGSRAARRGASTACGRQPDRSEHVVDGELPDVRPNCIPGPRDPSRGWRELGEGVE
jgi:hypothetical protein